MDYRSGNLGRVFLLRLDDGDDLHACLRELIAREKIESGWFQVFGGLRRAEVVTGPREPVAPPEPVWHTMDEAREILGLGSVYSEGDEPRIHLHAAMGHHGDTLTACVRKDAQVYLVLEVLFYELTGFTVIRPWNPEWGFNRLTFA
ncbi:MAG: DNA-binding protein [Desulfobulbaceae bacterium A2]|nr:MAG: DNA-binding protein [Desulfobulbaceae bacterium A2]